MTSDDWRKRAMEALDAEDAERITKYLDGLPLRVRQVVILRKGLGKSQAEIAADLGISMQEVEDDMVTAVRAFADQTEIDPGKMN